MFFLFFGARSKDMSEENQPAHRLKFQIERIAFFSDAIFAIAVTLMVIDVKPPDLKAGTSFGQATMELLNLAPEMISVFLSFFLISLFWWQHHRLFEHLNKYTNKLIWLNKISVSVS